MLIKLGTYLVLRRVWIPIDFQGHRSKVNVTGSIVYCVTFLQNIKPKCQIKWEEQYGGYIDWTQIWTTLKKERATQMVAYPLAEKLDPVTLTFDLENK
jgi:hypothetical protein